MKSRASIKSHPLHPILVTFPIAFFFGAFVFDLLSLITGNSEYSHTGFFLVIAGVAGGLLAAVPGIIDFIYTIPPDSSAKKRGAKHGIINSFNVLLFAGIAWYRYNSAEDMTIVMMLEGIGVVLLSIAGWLGGTLVYRNQIGVNPRYADAGKWKEEYIRSKSEWVAVAKEDELKINQMKLIHLNGERIVIGMTELGYLAFSDHCTHKGASLAGGSLICGTVQCPWHGSQFDVQSGTVKAGPADERIKTYSVQMKEGEVYIHNPVHNKLSS